MNTGIRQEKLKSICASIQTYMHAPIHTHNHACIHTNMPCVLKEAKTQNNLH